MPAPQPRKLPHLLTKQWTLKSKWGIVHCFVNRWGSFRGCGAGIMVFCAFVYLFCLWLVGWLVRHAPIMAAAGDRLHPVHCAQAQVAHCSVLVTLGQWRTSDGDPVVACPAGSELISPPYWEYELNRREGPTAIRYTHTSLVWAESTQ